MRKIFLLLVIFFLCGVNAACASVPYDEGGYIVVESEGRGRTPSEARIDARRNAAQTAVGFVSEGMTGYDGRNLNERIIRITRAVTGGEEELELKEERGRYTVKIRARIKRTDILSSITRRNPALSEFSGASVFASAAADELRERNTGEALSEVFGSFPADDYVNVTAEVLGVNVRRETLDMRINIAFDRERYFSEAVPQLVNVLDYVSDSCVRDVPFLLTLSAGRDGITGVTLPENLGSLHDYLAVMELEGGNRYIDSEGGGFANVYILTKDYYFNAYRVRTSAFERLIDSAFTSDRQGNITGNQAESSELKISFMTSGGTPLAKPSAIPVPGVRNIMLFPDTGIRRHKRGKTDESRRAVFILPAIGLDGKLFSRIDDTLAVTFPADSMLSSGNISVQCALTLKK